MTKNTNHGFRKLIFSIGALIFAAGAWVLILPLFLPIYGHAQESTPETTPPMILASDPVFEPLPTEAPTKSPGNPHAFTLTELSGMAKLPESDDYAVMLTDGAFEGDAMELQPSMVIISSDAQGASAQDKDIDLELFAAVMMYLNEELFKSIKVKDSKLLTIADLPSAETQAKAKGVKSGEKLKVVQWMLFSEDGKFIKILGFAPKKQFEAALPRFEAVRDGMVVGD